MPINKFLSTFCLITSFMVIFSYSVNAQTDSISIQGKDYLQILPDNILNIEEKQVLIDACGDGKCETTEPIMMVKYVGDKIVDKKENEIIEKRTVNSETYDLGKGKYEAIVYSGDNYFNDNGTWKQIENKYIDPVLYDTLMMKKVNFWNFFLKPVNAQYYSDANDGECYYDSASTWANVRAYSSGTCDGTATAQYIVGHCWNLTNCGIYRGFFAFDLDSIPSNATIASSTFYVTTGDTCGDYEDPTYFVSGTTWNNTALTGTDYAKFTNNLYSTTTAALNTTETQVAIPLNSTGLDEIEDNKGGYAKMMLRGKYDALNITPPSNTNYRCKFHFTEETGTSKDPHLTIEYSVPSLPDLDMGGLEASDDFTVITGYIEHYTTSTTTPSEIEHIYLHIPFFGWIILTILVLVSFNWLIKEFVIRLRKH